MNKPLTKEEREAIQALLGLGSTEISELWLNDHDKRDSWEVLEDYEATVQDLEAQLASEKQQHKIMDAAYWAAKGREADQTAALGALAKSLKLTAESHHEYHDHCLTPTDCQQQSCINIRQALAPGFVQQAVEASRAKDAEIVRLKERAKDHAELHLKHLETEAKLVVATGLLTKVHGLDCRFCGNLLRLGHKDDCEYADFLADPSQAIEGYRRAMQPMFQLGDFTLHSGQKSHWKIECDAAKDGDWECLAAMIAEWQVFRSVVGVPSQEGHKPNGVILAKALEKYATDGPVLVVDDVLTTGNSILEIMASYPGAVGWVVFARGDCPPGVQALFQMPTEDYHWAMQVVERVKEAIRHIQLSTPVDVRWRREPLFQLQALLGDAEQEEKP